MARLHPVSGQKDAKAIAAAGDPVRMAPSLRERLQAGLPAAMKAGDRLRVSVLRTTLAAIANAEAVDASATRPARGAFAGDDRPTFRYADGPPCTARFTTADWGR